MNKISIGSNVNPMVNDDFCHLGPCVKPFDGKVGQTTTLD